MTRCISRSSVSIPIGTSLSTEYTIDGKPPTILEMPIAWTAADICFTCSDAMNDFYICDDTGVLIQIPTDLYHRIVLPYAYLKNHKTIRIQSGTPTVKVNQAAARTIYLEVWA